MVKGLSISAQDGVTWKAMLLWKAAGSDMLKRQQAMITISHTLSLVKNNFTRAEYVKSLSKLMRIGRKDLEASVKNAGENTATVIEDEDERLFKLPDRKSTSLNSSHITISYAVFCLKKKKKKKTKISKTNKKKKDKKKRIKRK